MDNVRDSAGPKYEKSNLTGIEAERILSRVVSLMKESKAYRDPEFDLQKLSRLLGLPRGRISQALNQHAHISFYDFINRFRLEEAKRLLSDPGREMSILEAAFDAGFKSKATFYVAFKKAEGLSPSKFRERVTSPSPIENASKG